MKIKPELEKQICHLRDAAIESYECDFSHIPMPCYYFDALVRDGGTISKASCAKCRSECMVFVDGDSVLVDCYTLMIIDFLKSCGVEVGDES